MLTNFISAMGKPPRISGNCISDRFGWYEQSTSHSPVWDMQLTRRPFLWPFSFFAGMLHRTRMIHLTFASPTKAVICAVSVLTGVKLPLLSTLRTEALSVIQLEGWTLVPVMISVVGSPLTGIVQSKIRSPLCFVSGSSGNTYSLLVLTPRDAASTWTPMLLCPDSSDIDGERFGCTGATGTIVSAVVGALAASALLPVLRTRTIQSSYNPHDAERTRKPCPPSG